MRRAFSSEGQKSRLHKRRWPDLSLPADSVIAPPRCGCVEPGITVSSSVTNFSDRRVRRRYTLPQLIRT